LEGRERLDESPGYVSLKIWLCSLEWRAGDTAVLSG